jgi:hypothetical protein
VSTPFAESQSDAKADQYGTCTPVLDSRPNGPASNPAGDAAASKRDSQVCRDSRDLKQQAEHEHLNPGLAAIGINELR